jgi:hypothetical protein
MLWFGIKDGYKFHSFCWGMGRGGGGPEKVTLPPFYFFLWHYKHYSTLFILISLVLARARWLQIAEIFLNHHDLVFFQYCCLQISFFPVFEKPPHIWLCTLNIHFEEWQCIVQSKYGTFIWSKEGMGWAGNKSLRAHSFVSLLYLKDIIIPALSPINVYDIWLQYIWLCTCKKEAPNSNYSKGLPHVIYL